MSVVRRDTVHDWTTDLSLDFSPQQQSLIIQQPQLGLSRPVRLRFLQMLNYICWDVVRVILGGSVFLKPLFQN